MSIAAQRCLTFALCVAALAGGPEYCLGQSPPSAPESRSWALLIGVSDYEQASPLQFTSNDVVQLSQTLVQYGGLSQACVRTLTDQAATPARQPTKAGLEAALPEFLARPGPQDSIIVYFSGHGFRDSAGRLYLAPKDCDPANAAATGVSIEWFRGELEKCRAGSKLLILDACHAGSEKGDEPASAVAARELGESFKNSVGVVTLASSKADEKSQIWQFKQQSLFTYWLNQGLKGHADAAGDGSVNVDELYQYVHNHVSQTAAIRFGRPQTPVRIVGARVAGVPEVVRLQPQTLKQVLADMADQLAGLLEERQLASVGVLEFSNDTPLGELLGADFGLLGRYCAVELERQLIERCAGKYSVVDQARLQKALTARQFTLTSFTSTEALAGVSKDVGGMPALVKGTLYNRLGRMINLRCKLLETEGDQTIGYVGGVAELSESEWAMLGRSVSIPPEDRRPIFSRPGQQTQPPAPDRVIANADRRAEGPHPFTDPAFPYRVRMMIGGKERKPLQRGNDWLLPVRKGEVYELWVEVRNDRPVIVRLLVDGLNTLPEVSGDEKGLQTTLISKPVNLDDARFWVLDPTDPHTFRKNGVAIWAIRGFVSELGTAGKLREFVVVDADASLAARQKFTAQIGIITAAFYYPASSTRGVGTGAGAERTESIARRDDLDVGHLIGVAHLRYVDERELAP